MEREVRVGGKNYDLIRNTAKRYDEGKDKPVVGANSTTDKHRRKVEKLMSRMDKPINIPERPKEWTPAQPREFVRNVMGSSAGAGSGEFHVYRAIRKRTMQREAWMDKQKKISDEQAAFEERVRENKEKEEARTAKKRAKRQRKKANKKKPKLEEEEEEEEESKEEMKVEEMKEEEMKEEVKVESGDAAQENGDKGSSDGDNCKSEEVNEESKTVDQKEEEVRDRDSGTISTEAVEAGQEGK